MYRAQTYTFFFFFPENVLFLGFPLNCRGSVTWSEFCQSGSCNLKSTFCDLEGLVNNWPFGINLHRLNLEGYGNVLYCLTASKNDHTVSSGLVWKKQQHNRQNTIQRLVFSQHLNNILLSDPMTFYYICYAICPKAQTYFTASLLVRSQILMMFIAICLKDGLQAAQTFCTRRLGFNVVTLNKIFF